MKKTRLIQIGKFYHPYPGGMETHLYDLCNAFKNKFALEVLVANNKLKTITEEVNGVTVTRIASFGEMFSSSICPTFPYHLRQLNTDENTIIQMHLPNPLAHFSYQFTGMKGKLVLMWHSDIIRQKRLSQIYDHHLNKLLAKADRIIATSPNYIESSPYLSRFKNKCSVVPLGIDLNKFNFTPQVEAQIKQIKQRFKENIILFVGRLTYYKGLLDLLKAAENIDAEIIIIGDGPLKENLNQIINQKKLTHKVHMYHNIDNNELVAYYHACDIFVLPSNERSEAFGVVQLEAMACGKPIVSTNLNTGVPWVNQHGETGLVVEAKKPIALATAINLLLNKHDKRKEMGLKAKKRVSQLFTTEVVFSKMEQILQSVFR